MTAPTGTVTFLFTDIEGSTRLWEQHPQAMCDALGRHNMLLHQAIAAHDGVVFKTMGDAFCAAFPTAPDALRAAVTAQQSLQSELWANSVPLRVRMALHTGTCAVRDGDYFGPPLNRVARLLSAGHGEQILLSQSAYELTHDALPAGCSLQDLGAHSLRDLARPERVYQLCCLELRAEFPPLKSLKTLPNNLPQQVTSFVGRERELGVIKDLLSRTRLLTLTGSGGCGKTRLSLQAAADVLDAYPDGVWLVELAPLTDPDLVPQTIANVLGIAEQPGQSYLQSMLESLRSKTLLLILDNCEHILTACALLVTDLMRNCPNVKILASSREGLGIAGETVYRIPSLSLPDRKQKATPESLPQYEAVRLFLDRAEAVLPAFAVTSANAPALASVCHRLDGIPLAIELAAARVRALSVEEINARLDNRFRLLTGGSKTALPRQQTLRALIDWSYGLLHGQEKVLLARLSVFIGGWTLAAAEAVCTGDEVEDWEVLDLLTSLVDKSLVSAEAEGGQTRYRLLETVRQYARDRLVEGAEELLAHKKHRDYFLTLAEEADPKLRGPEQVRWLSVLETEHDNLRQALTFCLEERDGAEKGLRLGDALHDFWWTRGHLSEGRERLAALLLLPEVQAHPRELAAALNGAGILAYRQGDYRVAQWHYVRSLELRQKIGDRDGMAAALNNLGNLAKNQGDYAATGALYQEALTLNQASGNRRWEASNLGNLGNLARMQGDFGMAWSLQQESLKIKRELGDRNGIATSLNNLAWVAHDQGDFAAAWSLHQESLALYREVENTNGIADSLEAFATLAIKKNKTERAGCLFGAAEALREVLGSPLAPSESAEHDRQVAMLWGMVSEAEFQSAWTGGRAMSWEIAIEYALAE